MSTIQGHGISYKRVALAIGAVALVAGGIGYVTGGGSTPTKVASNSRINPIGSMPAVPEYGHPAPPKIERAALVPNLAKPAADKPSEQKPTGPAKPPQKSREQKLWEAHLDAGVGGTDYDDAENGPKAQLASHPGAGIGTSACFLPPTIPMTMRIESAGYTERGGMINGVIIAPVMGMGMACTVLPSGTRVTMEFWGEPGESQVVEIGFPTFVIPGSGAVQPSPIRGVPENASNRNSELPDHLSGWVTTPTFSLDSGDIATLQLRGEINATY
jgi:hypothetical protein